MISEAIEITILKKQHEELLQLIEMLRNRDKIDGEILITEKESLVITKIGAMLPIVFKRLEMQDKIIFDLSNGKKGGNNER